MDYDMQDRQGCLVPARRPLPIDHELFEQGNLEREELAYLESLQVTKQTTSDYPMLGTNQVQDA